MKKILDVSNFTRDDVVPYYTYLIISNASEGEVKRMNNLILSKWTKSGLLYIKNHAWKSAESLGYTFESGWGDKTLSQVFQAVKDYKTYYEDINKPGFCRLDGRTKICPQSDCDCKRRYKYGRTIKLYHD